MIAWRFDFKRTAITTTGRETCYRIGSVYESNSSVRTAQNIRPLPKLYS
jgi:hypothetical protein